MTLETTMLRMEILTIKIADIDLNKRIIRVPPVQIDEEERLQPISAQLAGILKDHLASIKRKKNKDVLFPPKKSTRGCYYYIQRGFQLVTKEADFGFWVTYETLHYTALINLSRAMAALETVKNTGGPINSKAV
jgi:integrase